MKKTTVNDVLFLYANMEMLLTPPSKLCRFDTSGLRLYYRMDEDGKLKTYTSTTSFCSAVRPTPPHLLEWFKKNGVEADNIRDEKADYGTLMHIQFAKFLMEGYDFDKTDIIVAEYLQQVERPAAKYHALWCYQLNKAIASFATFCQDYKVKPILIEGMLCSDTLGIAGTLDLICEMNAIPESEIKKREEKKKEKTPKEAKPVKEVEPVIEYDVTIQFMGAILPVTFKTTDKNETAAKKQFKTLGVKKFVKEMTLVFTPTATPQVIVTGDMAKGIKVETIVAQPISEEGFGGKNFKHHIEPVPFVKEIKQFTMTNEEYSDMLRLEMKKDKDALELWWKTMGAKYLFNPETVSFNKGIRKVFNATTIAPPANNFNTPVSETDTTASNVNDMDASLANQIQQKAVATLKEEVKQVVDELINETPVRIIGNVDFKSGGIFKSAALQLHVNRCLFEENFPHIKIDESYNWSPTDYKKEPTYKLVKQTEVFSKKDMDAYLHVFSIDVKNQSDRSYQQFHGLVTLDTPIADCLKTITLEQLLSPSKSTTDANSK